jgi:hypothetical protein
MAGHPQDHLYRVLASRSRGDRNTHLGPYTSFDQESSNERQSDAGADRRRSCDFAQTRSGFGDRPGGRNGVAAVNPVGLSKPGGSSRGASVRERFSWPGRPGGIAGVDRTTGGRRTPRQCHLERATQVHKGDEILGQIFGSKDGSRAVAASASAQSGVEPSLLKKMLPILAMVAAGYVMKQAGHGQGGLGGALGGILGGEPSQGSPDQTDAAPSASGGILGDLIGAAGKYLGR